MSNPDESIDDINEVRTSAVAMIGMAEGILVERYQMSAELATALLHSHSVAVGLPFAEVALRLLRTNALPGSATTSSSRRTRPPGLG